MKTVILVGGILLVGIGSADLLLGNTGNSPLPDFLTNVLTQQIDLTLLAIGGLTIWLAA